MELSDAHQVPSQGYTAIFEAKDQERNLRQLEPERYTRSKQLNSKLAAAMEIGIGKPRNAIFDLTFEIEAHYSSFR